MVILAHVETWRPYTAMYPGLVGLAGAALAGPSEAPLIFVAVAWLVPTLVWVAALYLGDYFDRDLDAVSKPHRPLPSGRMSPRCAVRTGLGCVVAAVGMGAAANWRTLVVTLIGVAGVVTYSRVFKSRGLAGNVNRGLLTPFALVFGAMAVQDVPPPTILPWALVFVLQDVASNLVGTLRDVEGDREGGYATLPVRRGSRHAAVVAAAAFAGAGLLALTTGFLVPGPSPNGVLLVGAVLLGAAAYTRLLALPELTADAALRTHEVLVVERLLLAAAVCTAGFGLAVTLAVSVPSLTITLASQHLLRRRHDLSPERTAVS
ncbi:UbiA family prenyltransferase [Allokutzneria sp. A3M-2-11 16]|uniref:UbiA family prenyltransferase n=1 Tax=Allokutzneria sp. A3M-2-11 16 TaxID=2962043 RepID=UPI0020B73EF5|nr:UbiA family prenyltransferase [Allokutzneria sp. A3M-2-11 16]MCP3805524.1 UbiA family prenyltransferase [Allokutzneria sp. A3M-2-11 16]